ncbi:MAG: ybeY [Gammaproteobacteria bacterium]|jgi:probable rRNA maturation factor|nr:ybeY [Gammaproteobacteria bacterium]
MNHIIIQYAVPKNNVPAAIHLKKWAKEVLAHRATNIEMTVRIVDATEMTQLNTQYRHKQGATNVLSFPFEAPEGLKDEPSQLGDIVICASVVNQEAFEQGKSALAHWAHMVVHGTLHLLGYDHETLSDAKIMEPLEISILKELGFPPPYHEGEQ